MSQATLLPSEHFSPSVSLHSGRPATTSLEVAQFFGKRHDHVMRSVRDLMDNCPEKFTAPNFGVSEYIDETGRSLPMFILYRDGFMLLVMGYTGKKALAMKLAYIEAFNRMEEELARQAEQEPPAVPADLAAQPPEESADVPEESAKELPADVPASEETPVPAEESPTDPAEEPAAVPEQIPAPAPESAPPEAPGSVSAAAQAPAPESPPAAAAPEETLPGRMLPDGSRYLNVMEILVEERLEKYVRLFGLCSCPRCLADVRALALSRLPAKYVVLPASAVRPMMSLYQAKFDAAVIAQVIQACKTVMESPRHAR